MQKHEQAKPRADIQGWLPNTPPQFAAPAGNSDPLHDNNVASMHCGTRSDPGHE